MNRGGLVSNTLRRTELIAGLSVYVTGTATIGFVVNDLRGVQNAPCLTSCQITTAPFDVRNARAVSSIMGSSKKAPFSKSVVRGISPRK